MRVSDHNGIQVLEGIEDSGNIFGNQANKHHKLGEVQNGGRRAQAVFKNKVGIREKVPQHGNNIKLVASSSPIHSKNTSMEPLVTGFVEIGPCATLKCANREVKRANEGHLTSQLNASRLEDMRKRLDTVTHTGRTISNL